MNTPSVSQLFDLSGKVAVVTGGGQGIGKGIAARLAEAGAAVLVADINLPAAAQTAQELKSLGHRVAAIHSDAGSVADAVRVAGAAVEQFGSLDILVNNAGIFPFAKFLEVNEALWDKVMTVNLKGVFFYSQAAAKAMIQGGRGGKIVNIASIDAFRPMGNLSHYDISKAGVVMLTKSLAIELGRGGRCDRAGRRSHSRRRTKLGRKTEDAGSHHGATSGGGECISIQDSVGPSRCSG